jgi:flagellar protein FlaG
MDINSTQVGQNFADIKTASSAKPADIEVDAVDKENMRDKSKEIAPSADNLFTARNIDEIGSVDEALTQINSFVQSKDRLLNFSVDEDSGRQVIKVTDQASGDIIRQIPTEEVLKLSARIQELQSDLGSAVGLFFDNQA